MAKNLLTADEKQLEGNDLAAHRLCKSGHQYKIKQLTSYHLTKTWLQSELLSKEFPVKGVAGANAPQLLLLCGLLSHHSLPNPVTPGVTVQGDTASAHILM